MGVHSVRYVHSVHCVRSGCTAVAPERLAGEDEIILKRADASYAFGLFPFHSIVSIACNSLYCLYKKGRNDSIDSIASNVSPLSAPKLHPTTGKAILRDTKKRSYIWSLFFS